MTEFSSLSDIFGRSAWPVIKEMDVEVFNINVDDRSCFVRLGGQEYKITRVHHRRWHVVATGDRWAFGSQWELLAWVGDRL